MRQLVARMGFLGDFVCTPPSAGDCDVSDNGLPSWMNVNMLTSPAQHNRVLLSLFPRSSDCLPRCRKGPP